jgi:hypothetical protein
MKLVVPFYDLKLAPAIYEQARLGTPLAVIANPHSGPSKHALPGWAPAVHKLQESGVAVGWYLDLFWWKGDAGWTGKQRFKTPAEMADELARYRRFYRVPVKVEPGQKPKDREFIPNFWFADDLTVKPTKDTELLAKFLSTGRGTAALWGNPGTAAADWGGFWHVLMTWEAADYARCKPARVIEAHLALDWTKDAQSLWKVARSKRPAFLYGTPAADNWQAYDEISPLFADLCALARQHAGPQEVTRLRELAALAKL